MFYWTRFDGKLEVYVDGTDLVPNQNPETSKAWMNAITALEERGYASNHGLKVGVFVLTDKGHTVARQLIANAPTSVDRSESETEATVTSSAAR